MQFQFAQNPELVGKARVALQMPGKSQNLSASCVSCWGWLNTLNNSALLVVLKGAGMLKAITNVLFKMHFLRFCTLHLCLFILEGSNFFNFILRLFWPCWCCTIHTVDLSITYDSLGLAISIACWAEFPLTAHHLIGSAHVKKQSSKQLKKVGVPMSHLSPS